MNYDNSTIHKYQIRHVTNIVYSHRKLIIKQFMSYLFYDFDHSIHIHLYNIMF